jgi:hypothetical protein
VTGVAVFYVHTAIVEKYLGTGAYGDSFAAPATISGFLDDDRKLVVSSTGEQVVSESTFYTYPANAALFTVDSRVTVNGRETRVIGVKRRDSGPLNLPDHVEVVLR